MLHFEILAECIRRKEKTGGRVTYGGCCFCTLGRKRKAPSSGLKGSAQDLLGSWRENVQLGAGRAGCRLRHEFVPSWTCLRRDEFWGVEASLRRRILGMFPLWPRAEARAWQTAGLRWWVEVDEASRPRSENTGWARGGPSADRRGTQYWRSLVASRNHKPSHMHDESHETKHLVGHNGGRRRIRELNRPWHYGRTEKRELPG